MFNIGKLDICIPLLDERKNENLLWGRNCRGVALLMNALTNCTLLDLYRGTNIKTCYLVVVLCSASVARTRNDSG